MENRDEFICNICERKFFSEFYYDSHINGRPHKEVVQKKKEAERKANEATQKSPGIDQAGPGKLPANFKPPVLQRQNAFIEKKVKQFPPVFALILPE